MLLMLYSCQSFAQNVATDDDAAWPTYSNELYTYNKMIELEPFIVDDFKHHETKADRKEEKELTRLTPAQFIQQGKKHYHNQHESKHIFTDGQTRVKITQSIVGNALETVTETWSTANPSYVTAMSAGLLAAMTIYPQWIPHPWSLPSKAFKNISNLYNNEKVNKVSFSTDHLNCGVICEFSPFYKKIHVREHLQTPLLNMVGHVPTTLAAGYLGYQVYLNSVSSSAQKARQEQAAKDADQVAKLLAKFQA